MRGQRTSARRWSRGTPLDLVLAAVLALLTATVAARGWPVRLDLAVFRALPSPSGPGPARVVGDVAQLIATVATPQATLTLTLVAATLLSARARTTRALRRVLPPVLAVTVSVLGGKALLHRDGPPGSSAHGHLGYFPSGHTAAALVCAGTLAALLSDGSPGRRTWLRVLAALWTVVVASAMVFHRYHWVTDVVASGLLGVLILRLTRPGRDGHDEHRHAEQEVGAG